MILVGETVIPVEAEVLNITSLVNTVLRYKRCKLFYI